ncbi:MAG TPA: hypothetical protein V6C81_31550 [Planktothrix sp.]|jgi:hypothetical protein
MKAIMGSAILVLALSLSGCTASDKAQISHLERDSASGLNALGKEASKAGQNIKSSVNEVQKDSGNRSKESKTTASLQQDASKAIISVKQAADKADSAIVGVVKDGTEKVRAADSERKVSPK